MVYKSQSANEVIEQQPIVAEKGQILRCAYCGGVKWHRGEQYGELAADGFKPTTVEWRCVGCHNTVTDQQVRDYFAKL